jgi:glutamyl-tRNA reductase
MHLWAIGISHATAQVELRSRLAFATDEIVPALQSLGAAMPTARIEAAILSTCNRTELYCAAAEPAVEESLDWFAASRSAPAALLRSHGYALSGPDAVRHALRVASGLDSMVLGEPQILGQMKSAVGTAQHAGMLGTTLSHLFQRAFATAKQVRSATGIGTRSVSIAAVAVQLAMRHLGDLSDCAVLCIGAGKMGELLATHFSARNVRHLAIANRTAERGEALALRSGAQAIPWSEMPARLAHFDVVISSTGSQLPVLRTSMVEEAMRTRGGRPMLIFDLAVPCDVDAAVTRTPGVSLYTLDHLEHATEASRAHRQRAARQAEEIVGQAVDSFENWLGQRRAVPLIHRLQEQVETWQSAELQRARRRLARGVDPAQVLESLTRSLSRKMLHGALAHLHEGDEELLAKTSSAIELLFLQQRRGRIGSNPVRTSH